MTLLLRRNQAVELRPRADRHRRLERASQDGAAAARNQRRAAGAQATHRGPAPRMAQMHSLRPAISCVIFSRSMHACINSRGNPQSIDPLDVRQEGPRAAGRVAQPADGPGPALVGAANGSTQTRIARRPVGQRARGYPIQAIAPSLPVNARDGDRRLAPPVSQLPVGSPLTPRGRNPSDGSSRAGSAHDLPRSHCRRSAWSGPCQSA